MELIKVKELMKRMATSDSMNQGDREMALDILLQEPDLSFPEFSDKIRRFLFDLIVSYRIEGDELTQLAMEQYTVIVADMKANEYLPVNIGVKGDKPVYIPTNIFNTLVELLDTHQKLGAIKLIRDHFGFGTINLQQTKDIVEAYMKEHEIGDHRPITSKDDEKAFGLNPD